MNAASTQKSTTARTSRRPRAPAWVRSGMQVAGKVAPAVAAQVAAKVFFSPQRQRPKADEHLVLSRGEAFSLTVMGEAVQGWAWGKGPTVLLVHGWSGYAGQLANFVPALEHAGFRVVAVDLPGHGASGGQSSSLVHGARALEQVDHLFGPLHGLLAHSFGAACAGLAMAWGLKVERAVFVAPSARFDDFWERFRDGLGVSQQVFDRMVHDAEGRLQVRFEDVLPLKLAPRQEAPLLVIHDRHDREIPLEEGERLSRAWPNASLWETHGLGHLRILKDPQVVARAVDAFRGASPPAP